MIYPLHFLTGAYVPNNIDSSEAERFFFLFLLLGIYITNNHSVINYFLDTVIKVYDKTLIFECSGLIKRIKKDMKNCQLVMKDKKIK